MTKLSMFTDLQLTSLNESYSNIEQTLKHHTKYTYAFALVFWPRITMCCQVKFSTTTNKWLV